MFRAQRVGDSRRVGPFADAGGPQKDVGQRTPVAAGRGALALWRGGGGIGGGGGGGGRGRRIRRRRCSCACCCRLGVERGAKKRTPLFFYFVSLLFYRRLPSFLGGKVVSFSFFFSSFLFSHTQKISALSASSLVRRLLLRRRALRRSAERARARALGGRGLTPLLQGVPVAVREWRPK